MTLGTFNVAGVKSPPSSTSSESTLGLRSAVRRITGKWRSMTMGTGVDIDEALSALRSSRSPAPASGEGSALSGGHRLVQCPKCLTYLRYQGDDEANDVDPLIPPHKCLSGVG
jgi:hypothetical protein